MQSKSCVICGTDSLYSVLFPAKLPKEIPSLAGRRPPEQGGHFRMVKCKSCGLIYSNPIYDSQQFDEAYVNAEFIVEKQISNYARDYSRQLKRLMPRIDTTENLLEIGCSDGFFLDIAKAAGFNNVYGVEPGLEAVRQVSSEIRRNIIPESFRAGLFEDEMFDVICLFQVFDHLLDPAKVVEDLRPMLKPGGWLFAINHNIRCWMTRILKESSPMFDTMHIYLFDKRTMKLFMEKHGFERVTCESMANRYTLNYSLKMLPLPSKIKSTLMRAIDAVNCGDLTVKMTAGNMVTFAQKPM